MITLTQVFAGIGMASCVMVAIYTFVSVVTDYASLKRQVEFLDNQDTKNIEWVAKLERRITTLEKSDW